MARQKREVEDGGVYHIYNKVNEEKYLLECDIVKDMFLQVLDDAKFKKKYDFIIEDLTLMDNHVHMTVKIGRGQSLAKIMQWIFSVFAIRYNRKFHRKGHFWIDRFKSVLIKSAEALERVAKYICYNPVRAGIVKAVEEYAYNIIGLVRHKIWHRLFGKIEI